MWVELTTVVDPNLRVVDEKNSVLVRNHKQFGKEHVLQKLFQLKRNEKKPVLMWPPFDIYLFKHA